MNLYIIIEIIMCFENFDIDSRGHVATDAASGGHTHEMVQYYIMSNELCRLTGVDTSYAFNTGYIV